MSSTWMKDSSETFYLRSFLRMTAGTMDHVCGLSSSFFIVFMNNGGAWGGMCNRGNYATQHDVSHGFSFNTLENEVRANGRSLSDLGYLKNHLCFSDYINCKHKEAIQPSATAKPTILAKEVTERPISKLERDLTHKNLMMSWEKWEEETEALYDEALKLMPDCEMLKKLKIEVEKEIKNVISMLNKWK